jgi:hypothetical protein
MGGGLHALGGVESLLRLSRVLLTLTRLSLLLLTLTHLSLLLLLALVSVCACGVYYVYNEDTFI